MVQYHMLAKAKKLILTNPCTMQQFLYTQPTTKTSPLSQALPNHSAGWLRCAVAPVRALSLTEAYLRLIGAQHSSILQCPWWHGDVREELGFKDVVIRIVRVSEASTAVREILFSQGLIDSSIW